MVSGRILEASRAQLRMVSEELAAYLAVSEQVFLDAGARLQELQLRARGLVEASSASAALAAQEDANDPVAHLESGLSDLRRCLGQSGAVLRDSARGLVGVLAGIDGLGHFRAEFQRSGVSLWSLAVSMRVESARAAGGAGFETVVADVRRLGAQIEPKFEAVLSRAHALRTTAAAALERAEAFLARDAGKLTEEIETTAGSVAALRTMRSTAAELRLSGSVTSGAIADEVSRILTLLQMHDIARQMIEHVREELDGVCDDDARDDLAEIAALANLQASQLGRARETLEGALEEIASRLCRISEAAVGLQEQTERMAELREGTSLFARVDQGIERSSAALREQLSRERFTTSAMCRVSAAMQDVAGDAKNIEQIGAEVRLIALNAQVQAEKSGDAGRALAVLARAIRELSIEVDQQTSKVGAVLTRISVEADKLGAEQAAGASEAAATEGVVSDMTALVERLHAQHGGLCAGIEAGARDGAALNREVTSLTGELSDEATRAGSLSVLEDALDEVSAAAAAECGDARFSAAVARLQKSMSRYTMERERAIHRIATHAEAEAKRAAAPPSAPAAVKDAGLGDNVELF